MTVETKDNWSEALLSLKKAYPDATISINPHGSSNPVKPEKAMPHTDVRAWQKRVFPERPPLTGPTDRYNSKKKPVSSFVVDVSKSSGVFEDGDQIIRTEEIERKIKEAGSPASKSSGKYDDPEGVEWYGPRDVSALSGLPGSHAHHAPATDYYRRKEERGQEYHGLRLLIATTQAENLSLKNSPAVCLQEQRLRLGKHFKRRVQAGELELQGQLDALREQCRNPEVPCPCPLCLHTTPLQRVKDIEASGRVQQPLPRPYGAKKGVQ